jgi:amino acid adenylation domain-containing protein
MQASPGLDADDVLLAVTTISFDIATLELYLPLIVGAKLIIAEQDDITNAEKLAAIITTQRVTVMQATPVTWRLLLGIVFQQSWRLNKLLTGGEALALELSSQLQRQADTVWNLYGPTETTVWSCIYQVVSAPAIPLSADLSSERIGYPIKNTQVYILNDQLDIVPVGISGELYIGGEGVAQGYLNRPELTVERFLVNPFMPAASGARIYRTGDVARWLPDGGIEYLGRTDFQVKLRGFRIELGEIEANLNKHPHIKQAVAHVIDETQQLAAWFTLAVDGEAPSEHALRQWLKASLPEYMIPSFFVNLENLPLTPNGKIDRKALPMPSTKTQAIATSLVSTPIEQLLIGIWMNVLKRQAICRTDNFFELGGHSLLATQLISRIRSSFTLDLPLRAIFDHPVLKDLAAAIENQHRTAPLPAIAVLPKQTHYSLSFAQQRLWFLHQLEGDSGSYNMPSALKLAGALAIDTLRASLMAMIGRHDSLRMFFPVRQDEVLVGLLEPYDPLVVIDLSSQAHALAQAQAMSLAQEDALRPFDLAHGPLLRVHLIKLAAEEYVLLFNLHHIIADAWSLAIFIRDFKQFYAGFATQQPIVLARPNIQYQDYASWQRQWLQGEVLQGQRDYWRHTLQNAPALLELPVDYPRPAQQSFRGAHHQQVLAPALAAKLGQLSQKHHATLFMTLLTGFAILLSRYSAQDDICIGSPIANRSQKQTEDLIGFFVNTLVLRLQLKGAPTFIECLKQVRQVCLEAYAHQDIPFEQVVEYVQPARSLSHSPLFQAMFSLQHSHETSLTLPGVEITPLAQPYPISKFDLSLDIREQENQLCCTWEYAGDLFHADTIAQMTRHFEILLNAIVASPDQSIRHLPFLTEPEIQQLQDWNQTTVEHQEEQTVVGLFENQAHRIPDKVAIIYVGQQLSYGQLNAQANQLAHFLLVKLAVLGLHVNSNTPIVLFLERSPMLLVAALAVLKAGGAYVPADPAYPSERLGFIIQDSAAPVLLTLQSLTAHLPGQQAWGGQCEIVCLDSLTLDTYSTENPLLQQQPEKLAYIIYTSGSTGKPKGVLIEHGAMANFVQAASRHYQINGQDRVLQFASFSFDAAVEEVYPALAQGSTLVLRTPNMLDSVQHFLHCCQQHSITVLDLPTAYWHTLMSDWQLAGQYWPASIRLVIIGGEAVSGEYARQWQSYFPRYPVLMNTYGPTEATVVATWCQLNGSLPTTAIGRLIDNMRAYVLDAYGEPLPVGISGELCLAGKGLARAYLNQTALTQEKFMTQEMFGNTERLYKTGDKVRWLADGQLAYMGRIDNQVKLRGFRIELGEIETVLEQHEAVQKAIVVLSNTQQQTALAAYVTLAQEGGNLKSALREFLAQRLPDYMMPSTFTVVRRFSLTSNGKVDFTALPPPEASQIDALQALPRSPAEAQLMQIWLGILPIPCLGIHDNFFELGGHSLSAVKLMSHVQQRFKQHLPLAALFQYPTIALLAQQLSDQSASGSWSNLVVMQDKGGRRPLFCLPGAGGNVVYLYNLVTHLGEQHPCYGLQTPGLDGISPVAESVEALAGQHIQLLRQQQPQGPYQLLGHSAGGRVAFEMACQLEAQGETISCLAILDTHAPQPEQYQEIAAWGEAEWFGYTVNILEGLTHTTLMLDVPSLIAGSAPHTWYPMLLECLKAQQVFLTPDADLAELEVFVRVFRRNIINHLQYAAKGKVSCPIQLYRAEDSATGDSSWLGHQDLGWGTLTTSQVEVIPVPGTHIDMLMPPQVGNLVQVLRKYLS